MTTLFLKFVCGINNEFQSVVDFSKLILVFVVKRVQMVSRSSVLISIRALTFF